MTFEVNAVKLTISVLIFISGLFGVLSPRLFNPFGTKISYANLISCGVLISAGLVHLLGDATEALNDSPLPKLEGGDSYPWSYMICGLSFILLFFFERLLIHQLLHNHHHHGHAHDKSHGHNFVTDTLAKYKEHSKSKPLLDEETRVRSHTVPVQNTFELVEQHHDHHHGHVRKHTEDMMVLLNEKNYFSSIVLLVGLGLHSFLAGLALGASSEDSELLSLGVAILSHKYLAAFAIGVPMSKAKMTLKISVAVAFGFAMMTPMGILIGFLLQNSMSSNPWIADIFICIASGTFLYVAICEIMIPEFSEEKKMEKQLYESVDKDCEQSCNTDCEEKQHDHEEMGKMVSVLLGFGIMSVLAIWS